MTIERRIQKAERALAIGAEPRLWILIVGKKPETEAERVAQEARRRACIEQVIREHPQDKFRLLLC
jgi:hypothetical protein